MKINHISAPMTGTEKSGLDLGCTRTTWLKWRKWGGRVVIRRSSARQTNTVDSTRPAWGGTLTSEYIWVLNSLMEGSIWVSFGFRN